MVKDSRPFSQRKKLKRKASWKDTIKGWASGGEDQPQPQPMRPRRSSISWRTPHKVDDRRSNSRVGTKDEGSLADAESSEDEDFKHYPEEAKPIRARIVYKYSNNGEPIERSKSMLEREQQELSIAVEQANDEATKGNRKSTHEPIGTRLTMTSRTGYFQDRIVAPSMVSVLNLCRELCLAMPLDACHGHSIHWPTPKPRLQY